MYIFLIVFVPHQEGTFLGLFHRESDPAVSVVTLGDKLVGVPVGKVAQRDILTAGGESAVLFHRAVGGGEELKDALEVTTTFVEGESTGPRPVMGTYFYLSPAVRAGAPATPESDRYALGVMFFRLLTGMWYEPGVDVGGMLAPFGDFWRRSIPQLLGVAGHRPSRGRRIAAALTVSAAFAVVAGLVMFRLNDPPANGSESLSRFDTEGEWALPPTFHPPARMWWR